MVRLEDCPTKRRERPMRYGVVLTGVLIVVALGTTSGVVAAPVAVPPAAVAVPQPAPVVPPVVVEQPVIVVRPPRPESCGVYRYWNGQYCVDARYNRPYLGPRP